MKYFTFIPAILLSLTSVNALAAQNNCKYIINGIIPPITPDPACNVMDEQPRHFPDLIFVGAPACFSGELVGTLSDDTIPSDDDKPIKGTIYAGVTENGIGLFTAASVIRLSIFNSRNFEVELGQIFTKDMVSVTPNAQPMVLGEILSIVEGTKRLKRSQGGLEIDGDALNPEDPAGVPVTGTLCY